MVVATIPAQGGSITVSSPAEFRQAVAAARPGARILLAPGEYRGGFHFSNLHGTKDKRITIGATDIDRPPHLVGGGSTLQLSDVSHLIVENLRISGASGNGVNIDDGGSIATPSHHVTLRKLHVSDLPRGNHDGIKLSGLNDFVVSDCKVERWGGSAIDMVGCHRGEIYRCNFSNGGDNAVQCKGGTAKVSIQDSKFVEYGQRGVNIGGSTGLQFFRPPLAQVKPGSRYEAKDIRVTGCTFIAGVAPFAFVGVDGALVKGNTVYNPERWVLRILQETRTPDFVPSRNGRFEDNLIVFRSNRWFSGGVNVGDLTAPETFRFSGNFWFCEDRPDRSRPTLPAQEVGGIYGKDPMFKDPAKPELGVKQGSPAVGVGAHSMER